MKGNATHKKEYCKVQIEKCKVQIGKSSDSLDFNSSLLSQGGSPQNRHNSPISAQFPTRCKAFFRCDRDKL